jgi:hypothetical protein
VNPSQRAKTLSADEAAPSDRGRKGDARGACDSPDQVPSVRGQGQTGPSQRNSEKSEDPKESQVC